MGGAQIRVEMIVNGLTVQRQVEPRLLLVDFLRDDLQLTGTHIGCDEGICGACTVEVNGEIIKSCLVFAVQADGGFVNTVEGVSQGKELDSVQEALCETHGIQCGYCTPGIVMAARNLLATNPSPSEDDVRRHLVGNLCRCGGYDNIVAAVLEAARSINARQGRGP